MKIAHDLRNGIYIARASGIALMKCGILIGPDLATFYFKDGDAYFRPHDNEVHFIFVAVVKQLEIADY